MGVLWMVYKNETIFIAELDVYSWVFGNDLGRITASIYCDDLEQIDRIKTQINSLPYDDKGFISNHLLFINNIHIDSFILHQLQKYDITGFYKSEISVYKRTINYEKIN
jgi:hypothetical protein